MFEIENEEIVYDPIMGRQKDSYLSDDELEEVQEDDVYDEVL